MDLGGLGMMRGFKSSQKMNKDQLKNKRRSAKSISIGFPEKAQIIDKPYDEEQKAAFKKEFDLKKQKEKRQKLIFIGVLTLISLVIFTLLFL